MLLVIDVGNTNITLGVFNGENLSATFRMTTKIQRTSDEYGIALNELIWHQGFEKSDIDACIVEYIVKKIKEESGYVDAKVVASGGLGKIIANETDIIDVYDPQLTLKGLRMIYEKNKR